MPTWIASCLGFVIASSALAAEGAKKDPLTRAEAGMRLRHAQELARDSNDPRLFDQVEEATQRVVESFKRNDLTAAELLVQGAEKAVGLDPGGKTMHGLPVAQLSKDMLRAVEKLTPRLEAALKQNDLEAVCSAVTELRRALGSQAGLPDARNRGEKPRVRAVKPAEVAELFVKVLDADRRTQAALAAGKPIPNGLPRFYASIAAGCCEARALIETHVPARAAAVDKLVKGSCAVMLELQTSQGFFRFPDLRGRHLRFGEWIEKRIQDDPGAVKDGWVVVPDPGGSSQLDAGECGMTLLQAGTLFQVDDWKKAGLRAADWALTQPCVANFTDNACSVSLLSEAYRLTKEPKYLDGAVRKFQIGIAPGQCDNGRWLDPHNARTAYHFIILRSLNQLTDVLPPEHRAVRDELAAISRKAVKVILDEFDSAGVTNVNHAVPELTRYQRLDPHGDARLRKHVERAAAAVLERCVRDGEVRAGVPLPALAAVARVWKE